MAATTARKGWKRYFFSPVCFSLVRLVCDSCKHQKAYEMMSGVVWHIYYCTQHHTLTRFPPPSSSCPMSSHLLPQDCWTYSRDGRRHCWCSHKGWLQSAHLKRCLFRLLVVGVFWYFFGGRQGDQLPTTTTYVSPFLCSRPSLSSFSLSSLFLSLDPTLLRSRLLNASPKHTRMISSSSLSSLLLFFFLGGCEECRWFQSYPSRGG